MVIKAQETDGMIAKDVLSCSRSCKLTGYETTRVRDKKRLEKVGNLVKNSYLYR